MRRVGDFNTEKDGKVESISLPPMARISLQRAHSTLEVKDSQLLIEQSIQVLFQELERADESYRTISTKQWAKFVEERKIEIAKVFI